jgi:maltooligosyltrehalose trehalohydrolase
VGNRMLGERLSMLATFEALKLSAGLVLLSPYIPLLFMGEEYGEKSPFLYFVNHSDPDLVDAVREGRKEEFRSFQWQGEPPDPQHLETFLQSKLKWEKREQPKHMVLLNFYRRLIQLRKAIPALHHMDKEALEVSVSEEEKLFLFHRGRGRSEVFCAMNFDGEAHSFTVTPIARWNKRIDSSEERWRGPGPLAPAACDKGQTVMIAPLSLALFEKEKNLE